MSNDYFKAQGWFKDYARNSQDSRGMFQRLVKEDEEAFKIASAETDKIKAMINKKFGPGSMKYGSEIPQPATRDDVIQIDAVNAFMKRNPAAEGGRIGKPGGVVEPGVMYYGEDVFLDVLPFKKLKNGKYSIRLYFGTDKDGKSIEKTFKGTKEELRKIYKDHKFVKTSGASKTASGNQAVIDFLEDYKKKNPGKPLDTFSLNEAVKEAYGEEFFKEKGITPAKKANDIMTSNPSWWQKATEDLKIEYTVKGKGYGNTLYTENADFRKFVEDKGIKWEDISVEDRGIKRSLAEEFELDLQRQKVVPKEEYIKAHDLAEELGMNPDTLKTTRHRESYADFNKEFNKYFKPKKFNNELYYKRITPDEMAGWKTWHEAYKIKDQASPERKAETSYKAKKRRELKEAVGTKYASELELKNSKKIKTQISDLNTMFKNKPELINTPRYEKLKEMMEIQIAGTDRTLPSGKKVKAGELFRREVDSKGNLLNDDYYIKKAKEGKIMSFFDINKVGTQMGKYATNINITPSIFNSAFIEGQVERYFSKGGKFYGDAEKLKKVDDYLKSIGITVKISDTEDYYKKGRIGGGEKVFYDSKTGDFPHIIKTLNTMGIQDDVLTEIKSSNIDYVGGQGGGFNKHVEAYITDRTGKVKQPMLPSGLAGAYEMLSDDLKKIVNSEGFKTFKAKIANPALKTALGAAKLPTKIFGVADLVLGYLDYTNNRQKGFSKEDSTRHMVDAILFGATSFGKKGDIEGVKKIAMQNGMSEEVFNNLVSVNLNQKKMIDRINESKAKFNESMDIIESGVGDTTGEQLLIQKLKVDTKEFLTNTMKDIVNDSRSLNTNLQVQEAGGPIDINVDTQKAFSDLGSSSREFVQKRIDASDPKVFEQGDTTMGKIGSAIDKTLLDKEFMAKFFIGDYRGMFDTKAIRREKGMAQLKKEDPTLYYRMLMSEGIDPRTKLNIPVHLEFERNNPEFGSQYSDALTQNKAEGGITQLRSKYEYKK